MHDPILDILRESSASLTALVADGDEASKDRAAFAQEARDAHAGTREAVGRIAGVGSFRLLHAPRKSTTGARPPKTFRTH